MSLASLAAKKVPFQGLWELRNITPWNDISSHFTLENLYGENCLDEEKIFFVLEKSNLKTLLWPYIIDDVVKIDYNVQDNITFVEGNPEYDQKAVEEFKNDLIHFIQDEGKLHYYEFSLLYFAYGSGIASGFNLAKENISSQTYQKIDDVLHHLLEIMLKEKVIEKFYDPLPVESLKTQIDEDVDIFNWDGLNKNYISIVDNFTILQPPELFNASYLIVIGDYLHVFYRDLITHDYIPPEGKYFKKEDGIKLLRTLKDVPMGVYKLYCTK